MKNSKYFFLLILMAGVGCSKKTPETLLSRFEKKAEKYDFAVRKLASTKEARCLADIFTPETLAEEVRELEKSYAGAPKVRGYWKHLDLSRLPVPQANFLKTYGDQIGDLRNPDSIDYSMCDNLPCIFNRIYGKENHVGGYVHYLWYLKFGHMLSLDNKVPEQTSNQPGVYNQKQFPLSAYLYNEKELYGLWRLSHMLKAPHTTLRYLKEVQRVPRGENFEGDYGSACGLAYSGGWIKLNDGCLTTYQNPDNGYLYQAVTHELNHHIDFEQGRGTRNFYRSHQQDYLNLAGFFKNEYVDENGTLVSQWAHKEGIKLVTSYAGTSPQENFAESLSMFRVDGDTTKKKITPQHFSFVSEEYYEGRSFEKEELMKAWIQEYSVETGKEVFKAVIDCNKKTGTFKSTYFKATDFSSPVLPSMLNCISARAEEISALIRSKAAVYQPEGCLAFNDFNLKGKWDVHMKNFLIGSFERYLEELKKDKDYIARIQSFYDQISNAEIAQSAYISCYKEPNEESCYANELQRAAFDKALSLNLPEAQTKEMAEMYISYHPYNSTKNNTLKGYQTFVQAHLDTIKRNATELWEGCRNIPHDDSESPTGSLFQIFNNGYMVSSFYNCLNMNIPDTVKDIVRGFEVDGLRLQHAKEELILSDDVLPRLVKELNQFHETNRKKEVEQAKVIIAKDNGKIRKAILSDFSWVTNVVDSAKFNSDCKKAAVRQIDFNPLFNLKFDLFGEFVEKNVCVNITSSPEYNNWLENSKEVFQEKISKGLEEKIWDIAVAKADSCIQRFPMNNMVNKLRYKIQREACLTDEWPALENKVIAEAMQDPMVIRFRMSADEIRSKLLTMRRRLQLRLIKEKFN